MCEFIVATIWCSREVVLPKYDIVLCEHELLGCRVESVCGIVLLIILVCGVCVCVFDIWKAGGW